MYQSGYSFEELNSKFNQNILKVVGEGTINVAPNIAEIEIGAITENIKLKLAQEENSRRINSIISALKDSGIESKDIKTKNYNVNIKNDYINGKQVFSGYEVSNYLNITVKNIDSIGEIIDIAVKNEANYVNKINFLVSDITRYYNQALKLAIEDAQNKAIIMVSKLKAKINILPLKIVEIDASNEFYQSSALKSSINTTPIEPGRNTVTATIEAVFIYI